MSVLRGSADVLDERSWECEVTVGSGEVWEYLYHNHTRINHITKPVSVAAVSDTSHLLTNINFVYCAYLDVATAW